MNSDLQVDTSFLAGREVGSVLEFEREVPKPGLADLQKPADLTVSGTIEQLDGSWLVTGNARLSVTLACARCLKAFRKEIPTDFSEEFSLNPSEDQFRGEENRIDLTDMLRSVLLLAVPLRPLHDPKCRGLCAVCGKDLNAEPHSHKASVKRENPFSALKAKGK